MDETNTPARADTTTDGLPPPAEQPLPNWNELIRELDELGRTRPIPDFQDQLVEIRWWEAHRYDPEIQAHRGDYVAIYQEKIVGFGTDRLTLELECAKRFGVHPARVQIEWIDDGRDLHVTLVSGFVELPPRKPDAPDPR